MKPSMFDDHHWSRFTCLSERKPVTRPTKEYVPKANKNKNNSRKYKWLEQVWKKDPNCRNCGIETVLRLRRGFMVPNLATCDHIVPISKGGRRNSVKNWQLFCSSCNAEKGNSFTFNDVRPDRIIADAFNALE